MGRPVFALALTLGAALWGPVPVALSAALHHDAAASAPTAGQTTGTAQNGPTLTLLSQSPWVGPGQPMQLRLGVSGAPASQLSLEVTLYQHLTSRFAFAETAGGTAVGPVLASATVGVSSLPPDPQGGVDLTIPLSSGDAPASGTGPLTASLDCLPGNCGGVYPLRLELVPTTGEARSELLTYVVYVHPAANTQRLRLAWILPLALPPAADASGPDTSSAALDTLQQRLATVTDHPSVPVTLAPDGATVTALASSSQARDRSTLATMEALAQEPARQTLGTPYVPVDATSLESAGLGGELGQQVRRADAVLATMHPTGSTWLAEGSLDQASIAALGSLGFGRLVVPSGDVSQGPGPSLTAAAPFTLDAGHGVTALAVEADSGLAADISAGTQSGDALAAYRMLADLAMVYYEEPNDETPRGLVVAGTPSAQPDPRLLDTVLGALETDPLVTPVAVDALFSSVPSSSTTRRLVVSNTSSSLPVRQLRSARSRLSAFSSAVEDDGTPVVHALDDELLWSEDDELRPAQQQREVSAFDKALHSQLSGITIRADTIRLTSTAARVPITVLKQSGYGMTGTLEVSGDKVVFPSGAAQSPGPVCRSSIEAVSAERSSFSCLATIGQPTNAVYLDMRARDTGDFRLDVTFTSPAGGLVLASTHVTVRSVSTSLVAVGLSAAAGVVLLVWWGRTLWRRHPGAHGAHARRPGTSRARS